MIRKERNGIAWLEFELLADAPGLVHAIFLRHGGVSPPPFDSLNVGGGSGDSPENITKNRKKVSDFFHVNELVSGKQVHGKEIHHLLASDREVGTCDAIVTQEKKRALVIKHADCQAAIFYDPVSRSVANVHCGWRGNVQNIYRETTERMRELFKSKPENLLVGISPSLGPEHAEFQNYREELPESFWEFQVKPNYFDLWEISRRELLHAGILPHHIEIASICTYAHAADCFSYRRDKRVTGRHATVALLM